MHQGIDVYMECTIQRAAQGRRPRLRARFGYWRETGRVRRCSRPRRSCSPPAASARRGRSPRTPGSTPATASRMALEAGADLIDMEFVQFHPTGMVWPPSVRGILVTEGVRGDGGMLQEHRRRAVHVRLHPRVLQGRDGRHRGGSRRAGTSDKTNNRAHARTCCRATRSPGRSTPRSRPAAAARTAACSSTSPRAGPADYIKQAPAVDVPPVQGAGRRRHHQGADGGRPDLPLHDGRRAGRRRDARRPTVPGLFAAGEVAAGHARRQPAGRQLALRPARVRPARRAVRGASTPQARRSAAAIDDGAGRGGTRARCWRRSTRTGGENPYADPRRPAGHDAEPGRHHPHRGRAASRRSTSSSGSKERAEPRHASRATASTTPAGTWRSTCTTCSTVVRGGHPRGARAQGEPRRPHPRRLPGHRPALRQGQRGDRARDAATA